MRKWMPALFALAAFLFSFAVYGQLPDRMTVHWSVRGEPDGFASRMMGAFGIPVFMVVLWGILRLVPSLDPRRANIEKFRDSYETLIIAIIGAMLVLHVAVVGAALGWPISIVRVVPFVSGTLFIILGNLLPRFRSNFFLGIRTPWTLSNERVWARTHRMGGYVMVGAGLLMVLSVFVPWIPFFPVMFTSIMVAALGTVLYSYVVWREETRKS